MAADDMQARGIDSREMAFLRANAPRQSIDKWGKPLPLSAVDQDRLDRTFAIMASPLDRGRVLLESGQLTPGEVQALKATNPDVLSALQQQAAYEMANHGPPYAAWAEAVLGYLFQKPAAQFVSDKQPDTSKGGNQNTESPGAPPTPVDRLEKGVRLQAKG